MKKKTVLSFVLCLIIFLLSSCTRVGERDGTDFIVNMAKHGFDLTAEETVSTEYLKESYYVNSCKISVYLNENSKLYRLVLTYSKTAPKDFCFTAKCCIASFCGLEEAITEDIVSTLGFSPSPPDSTKGVARCESEYYLFSFTCDKAGGCLIIDSLRLNPTSAPTVTVRTTVPKITSAEESVSS